MFASTLETTSLLISCGNLEVRLAESFHEIDEAMRLRFEVFNLEMNEGLLSSYDRGYDSDAYDAWCDHLVVRDRELDRVVGTYRLLRQNVAERQIGFYSENEFDLSRLKRSARENGEELLELGRSCIASTHRTFATINLLWGAIAQYCLRNRIGLLFGCGSLHVTAATEVQPIYRYLHRHYLAPEKYRVEPVPHCRMVLDQSAESVDDERSIQRRLSPILRGYLRTGAMVCGEPALDQEFGTTDLLVLLEMSRMAGRYRQHYGIEE
ncbi:MAG: GNAT family N-acetyltransferase [Blastocatellia bacterium]|jgi:putative hemolysin